VQPGVSVTTLGILISVVALAACGHGLKHHSKRTGAVINLAYLALAGAQAHGPAIRLLHNTAALIEADLFRVTGDPDVPGVPGTQARLDAQLRAMKSAQAELDAALKAARDYCHMGIGILKPILGHRWNGDWLTAGFTSKRVAVPRVPLALLVEFRAYLTANPDRASASLHFTAADAQAHIETVQAAMQVRDTARGARWSVKAGRDDAFRQLRKRLSALRAELAQLISPMDDRWYGVWIPPTRGWQATEPCQASGGDTMRRRNCARELELCLVGAELSSNLATSRQRR
jgi:hypothetical protein